MSSTVIVQKLEKKNLLISESPEEHHVYIEWFLNGRAGGPPGYLANLLYGYNQVSNYDEPLIIFNAYRGTEPPKAVSKKSVLPAIVRGILSVFPGGKDFFINHLSRTQKKAFKDMTAFLSDTDKIMPDAGLIKSIDFSRTKSIHVHNVAEVVKIKNYLRKNYLDSIKVILTCHTPESIAKEQYALSVACGQSKKRAHIIENMWSELEKRGYREADIIIFPSKEAMEPMLNDVPEFKNIIKDKDIRFMATGSKQICSSLTKEEAKKKYGVSGKIVIGYIGRHNAVKGYDLLKEAAQRILKQRDDVVFLIGGAQGTEFAPLDSPSWIEAGWVNPADMLRALDVFVLPNRQTYYDLVLLEVLSMGVPTVATATGGNKSVKEIADDLVLCSVDSDSLADNILRVISLSQDELAAKGKRLQKHYENYFTEKHMAERYVETIRQIYNDYDLWEKKEVSLEHDKRNCSNI